MKRTDGRKASTVATNKYQKKVYDQLLIKVKKGKKELFYNACKMEGVTGQGYLNQCIDELICKHYDEGITGGRNEVNEEGTKE